MLSSPEITLPRLAAFTQQMSGETWKRPEQRDVEVKCDSVLSVSHEGQSCRSPLYLPGRKGYPHEAWICGRWTHG